MSEPTRAATTEKQQRILDAALDLFADRGFAGVSTSEIAKRAGVAEATIFKAWRTKKELLIATLAPAFFKVLAPRLLGEVRDLWAQPWDSFEALLRALLENRTAFIEQHHKVIRIALQELPFHDEVRDLAKKTLTTELWAHIEPAIVRFQSEGKLIDAPPHVIARTIVSMLMGWFVTRYMVAPEHPWDDDAEREQVVRMLVRALVPAQAAHLPAVHPPATRRP